MSKQLTFGNEALDKLASGSKKLNDAVSVTMGAKGRNVLIDVNYAGLPHITKDGVTVAKAIELNDPVENNACKLIKNVALRTNDQVGDGTTTSVVLANSLIQNGSKAIQTDSYNPVIVKRGIDFELQRVIESLNKQKMSISTPEEMYQVALVSANGDHEVAKLVTDVYKEVGKEGNVAIEIANDAPKSYFKKVEGITFDRGYTHPYYSNTPEATIESKNVSILISDYVIDDVNSLVGILEYISKNTVPLLIICEDIDAAVEAVLLQNNATNAINVCVVKAPEFGDRRVEFLEDLAVFTGGTYVNSMNGITLRDVKPEHFGTCQKILVDAEHTSIIKGAGDEELIKERLDRVKSQIESAQDAELKHYQEQRYAKLQSGVAVIKVGGYSDVEKLEIKDRVEDAVNAVKSALIDGIIPGGGSTLLRISDKGLKGEKLINSTQDFTKGRQILLDALRKPFRQILINAGEDYDVIEKELLKRGKNYVFDVSTRAFKDGFKVGIIDPVLVTKTALTNATSIAGTLLTTGCTINYEDGETQKDLTL